MSLALVYNTIINISLLVILCIGFTFTFMMEKFPNFAHTSYASIGTVVAFYLVRFRGFNPYQTWPVAVLVCGLLGVLLYVGVLHNVPYDLHGACDFQLLAPREQGCAVFRIHAPEL